ncbi:unnamed protein product [Dovyalis caffra]|uniref:Uncharacterized protein n=1 Tax=Dovyalis caffra TaxID=77055 RepID=A0AAV1SBN5_9ROSI|nr:unnamed protein product [Dovyalis caffra]
MTDKHAKCCVNLWMQPDRKLQTRVTMIGCSNFAWQEKFVYTVSENFLRSKNLSAVQLQPPLRIEKEGRYDTDDEYVSYYDDPRYDSSYESNKDGDTDGIKEETPEPEGFKASTSLQVSKGSKSKGVLSLDATVWKEYIKFIGSTKRQNAPLYYDEFMGLKGKRAQYREKRNHHAWLCFASTRNKEDD